MTSAKYLLPVLFFATALVSTHAHAQRVGAGQESQYERRRNETDEKAVREFVQSKENIEIKQKANNLEISGDIRFEWRHLNEVGRKVFLINGEFREFNLLLRGDNAIDTRFLPVSRNDWDTEFNLKVKYTYKNAWAAAHLQFDNSSGVRGFNDCVGVLGVLGAKNSHASLNSPGFGSSSFAVDGLSEAGEINVDSDGVFAAAVGRDGRLAPKGSGESAAINLKRAYMGYNIYADGVHRVDVEIGRRKLNDIFDSEIQFSSRFDGVVFKYASAIDRFADLYANLGVFIIDERVNHLGCALEFGFLDLFATGLDIKYSLIDWRKRGENRCYIKYPLGSEFLNSQITFSYNTLPEIRSKKIPVEWYGAFVINHDAKKTRFTHFKRKNLGWYLGVLVGDVDKEGDWSFDITYEYVQAQMASDIDVAGVGRGNILDEHFTDILVNANPAAEINAIIPRRGNANYRGWSFELFYALTDNLTFDIIYEFTRAEDARIGGHHYYSNAEIEAIYAF